MKCIVTSLAIIGYKNNVPVLEDQKDLRELFVYFDSTIYFHKNCAFHTRIQRILNNYIGKPLTDNIVTEAEYKINQLLYNSHFSGDIFYINEIPYPEKEDYLYIPETKGFKFIKRQKGA